MCIQAVSYTHLDVYKRQPYYPVNDEKNTALYAKYKELAEKEENVIFGGRLGLYRYMDMHHVVDAALQAVREEMK